MINLSTQSEQLSKELLADRKRAEYWLRKQYHGDKGFERMTDELTVKCYDTRSNQRSDIVEYKSANGNRWLVYAFCRYFDKSAAVRVSTISFCYYETLGSIGAFFINYDKYDSEYRHPVIVIFTSHFFQRFCERLGIEFRSRAMVQRFCEAIPGYTVYISEKKDKEGRYHVDVRLPGSIGRGVLRKSDCGVAVMEIRTYLTDKQLTPSQLRETKRLRRVADKYGHEPFEVAMKRISKLPFDEMAMEIQKLFDERVECGCPRELFELPMILGVFMVNYTYKHELVSVDDADRFGDLSERMHKAIMEPMMDYVKNGGDSRPVSEAFGRFMQKEFKGIDLAELYKEMEEYFNKLRGIAKQKQLNNKQHGTESKSKRHAE